jgi:hypothetical protein
MTLALLAAFLTMPATSSLILLALLGSAVAFGTFVHSGSYDASAQSDILVSQVSATTVALVANSTLPQNAMTGATDVYLVNTANAPGTQTTRTAAQLYADLTAQLGFPPPPNFAFILSISHSGTGTLTLAAGTGVTITSATAGTATSIATQTGREYLCTVVSPSAFTMVNLAILNL